MGVSVAGGCSQYGDIKLWLITSARYLDGFTKSHLLQ